MKPFDWSQVTKSLSCTQADLPQSGLDVQSSFAVAYHSIASMKARCYKNVDTITGESSSYIAEAILSTRSSSGHQLLARVFSAPEGKVGMVVCSDNPEESSSSLKDYERKYKALSDGVLKLDEKPRRKLLQTINVEMKLDEALNRIISKAPAGEVYPTIGIVRETLIKALEGFDTIHIETGEVMANLHNHQQDVALDSDESKSISIRILDWKKRLSRIIDEALSPRRDSSHTSGQAP